MKIAKTKGLNSEDLAHILPPYASDTPYFAWAKIVNGVYTQQCGWHACRETFTYDLVDSKFFGGTIFFMAHRPPLPKSKTKDAGKLTLAWTKSSLKLVHVIEKKLGWSLTRVKRVEVGKSSSKIAAYVYTASAKWKRAPQLMSLYLLLLRSARLKELSNINSYKAFEAGLDRIKTTIDKYNRLSFRAKAAKGRPYRGQFMRDAKWLSLVKPQLGLLLDNVNTLFFARQAKVNYQDSLSSYGVNKLLSAKPAANPAVKEAWLKVKKDAK